MDFHLKVLLAKKENISKPRKETSKGIMLDSVGRVRTNAREGCGGRKFLYEKLI